MKKLLLLAAAAVMTLPQTANADIIAGWDTFGPATAASGPTSAAFTASGITAEITGHNMTRFTNGRGASTDGTYGSIVGPPNASTVGTGGSTHLTAANGDSESVAFSVTNNTGSALSFDTFDLDAIGFRSNGARTLTLFLGDIATGTAINTPFTYTTTTGTASDLIGGSLLHEEVSLDISSIAALADGATYTFELALTGGTPGSGGNDSNIDNIAFSATAVPEPSSMAVLGLAGLAIFTRRRK